MEINFGRSLQTLIEPCTSPPPNIILALFPLDFDDNSFVQEDVQEDVDERADESEPEAEFQPSDPFDDEDDDDEEINSNLIQAIVAPVDDVRDGSTYAREYAAIKPTDVTLAELEEIYNEKDVYRSTQLLHNRPRIVLDGASLFTESDKFQIRSQGHYIDFFQVQAKSMGLPAIVPRYPPTGRFSLTIYLDKQHMSFPHKFVDVQFDLTGRMLMIGQLSNAQLWIGWFPVGYLNPEQDSNEYYLGDAEPQARVNNRIHTQMSAKNSRRFICFLVFCLSTIQSKSILCKNPYGADLTGPEPNFHQVSNFMYALPSIMQGTGS